MKNKGAFRAFLGVFLGLVGLFMLPGGVFAASFVETFSYSNGNLTAWDTTDVYYQVVDTNCIDEKCLYAGLNNIGWGSYQYKNIDSPATDVWYVSVWLKTDSTGSGGIMLRPINTSDVWLKDISLYNTRIKQGDDHILASTYSANTWYEIQVEYRKSDDNSRARYRQYGGAWQTWSGWSADLGSVELGSIALNQPSNTYKGWFDNIIVGEGNAPDDDDLEVPPSEIFTIDFQQPPDESSTPDFSNWLLKYQYYTGTTTPVSLLFSINAYSEAGLFFGNSYIVSSVVPDSTSTKFVFVPKSFVLPSNKWYNANASMALTFPGTILATSTSHFIVSTTSSAIWQIPPASTTTSTGFVLTCDPDSGFFKESLCYLGLYLFIPKYEDFSSFLETWDNIKNKIPIGYFTAAKTSLETLTTETESTITFSSLGDFTDYIKNFFTAAFWLLFVFWSFNRIRNLDL